MSAPNDNTDPQTSSDDSLNSNQQPARDSDDSEKEEVFSCQQCSEQFQLETRESDGSTAQAPSDSNAADVNVNREDDDFILCPNCGSLTLLGFSDSPTGSRDPKRTEAFQGRRYEFGEVIGKGSYGVVYAAFDNDLRRNVAIKAAQGKLAGKEADLFLREARSASRLRHPNIVTVHDILTTNEGVFIVSDLIVGDSLKNWLDENQPDQKQCIQLASKLCRAMDYAHRNGVIHRDLKPGNVVMDQEAEPHVLDFGLSQSIDNSLETISIDGVPIGTPAFMAPEQVRGKREEIDRRSDIFALGVILYQMLTGKLPFRGNRKQLFQQITSGSPDRMKSAKVPRSLQAICFKALSKDPGDRYQWASEMADDLQRFLDGKIVRASGSVDGRVVTTITRKYFLAATAVALMIALGLVSRQLYQNYEADNPVTQVMIETAPPGCQLTWRRYDPETGILEDESQVSNGGDIVSRIPGFYKIVAKSENEEFEVFRTVPKTGFQQAASIVYNDVTVYLKHRGFSEEAQYFELPSINIVPLSQATSGMTLIPGAEVRIPQSPAILPRFSGQSQLLSPYLLATHETTWSEVLEVWPDMILPLGTTADQPIKQINWDIAVAYAEQKGRCLPTVFELKNAATNAGTTIYPSGNEPSNEDEAKRGSIADWDQTKSKPPILGLLTGEAEWTEDPFLVLSYDNNKELVRVSAEHESITTINRAPFPSYWFIVDNKDNTLGTIEDFLRSGPSAQMNTAGFRTVRRLSTK